MEEKNTEVYLEPIDMSQEADAIFEEWAGGSSADLQKDEDDDELTKFRSVPVRRKRGNQKPSTVVTCEVCGVLLKHPSRIKEHMRTHTGEKPFECDICGMRFTQRTPMVNHYRVQHMGDMPFICSFGCGKRFVNNSRKNAHELRHVGLKRTGPPRPHLKPAKKLVCALDDKLLPVSTSANYMKPSILPNVYSSEELASTSNFPVSSPSADAEAHYSANQEPGSSKDSSERIDDVILSVLSRVLAPPVEEVIPVKEVEVPRKRGYVSSRAPTVAQCTICGIMLKHPSKIAEHIRTHTGDKPFECGECGMTLSKATSLKIHIRRMHTSERPFSCEWDCGMSFVTESVKKEHEMAVHAGVKRYTCVVKGCKAVFARRNYLMRHRKNVHGNVFCPVFDNMQVSNEEASDPILDDKSTYFDPEPMLMLGDDLKLLGQFDEEEFVEQEMSAKPINPSLNCLSKNAIMEESSSKLAESSRAPPLPPSISRFQYAQYSSSTIPLARVIQHSSVVGGPNYKRNDPANRSYRMRKRAPAQVYHCVQCNKNIKYPSKISEHIRKHTGEKPHSCHMCKQSFSQAHSLKAHLMLHISEKPYKCSFCTAVFMSTCEKNVHEAQHMHHSALGDSMDDDCAPFLEVGGAREEPIEHVEQVFYACPLSCGFQNPDEAVVLEHFHIDHERFEDVCWEEPNEPSEPSADAKIPLENIPVQNEMIESDFNEEPTEMYQFFDEPFDSQIASETIVEPTISEQPCSSNSVDYGQQYETEEASNRVVLNASQKYEIVYEGEGEGHVEEELGGKKMIIQSEQDIKQVVPNHMYGGVILDDLEAEVEDVGLLNDEEEEQERVRVIVNPNPPKRGSKSVRDHQEASAAMTEMVVDAATLELAAPTRHLKHGYPVLPRKNKPKTAQNLDWIIDAVAKGVDVNEASPHVRKKATLHKCEYCGRVDKYPSKIRAHMRTHTGEKPFKCDICGMTFSQRTPMRLHLRRHFDQKPYQCDIDGCKERFVSGAILKMHIEKKHLNKKKYVCSRGCGRVFSSAFNLRHHEKKCSQNTYLAWVEETESGEETVVDYPDDEEEYMDDMVDASASEPQVVDEHFAEEPVFLHQ